MNHKGFTLTDEWHDPQRLHLNRTDDRSSDHWDTGGSSDTAVSELCSTCSGERRFGPHKYSGKYVSTVSAQTVTTDNPNGTIHVNFGAAGAHDLIKDGILKLSPSAADSGAISWTCSSAIEVIESGSEADGNFEAGRPDVTKYLPSSCKAP